MKSLEILARCAELQAERGAEFNKKGSEERSHTVVAGMFNLLRGKDLAPSDIFLILEFLKLARQYSNPERLHADSVLDKTSYSSLWGEALIDEHTSAQKSGVARHESSPAAMGESWKHNHIPDHLKQYAGLSPYEALKEASRKTRTE